MSEQEPNLYRSYGTLRWGRLLDGVITFEPMLLSGGYYPECTTDDPLLPVFSVEKMGRYPTSEEYAAFNSRF